MLWFFIIALIKGIPYEQAASEHRDYNPNLLEFFRDCFGFGIRGLSLFVYGLISGFLLGLGAMFIVGEISEREFLQLAEITATLILAASLIGFMVKLKYPVSQKYYLMFTVKNKD